MFRQPRENPENSHNVLLGRPPTPPETPIKTPFTLAIARSVPAPKMAVTKTRPTSKPVALPTIGRQGLVGKRSPATLSKTKDARRPNGNILNFFKKSENGNALSDGLFIPDRGQSLSIMQDSEDELSNSQVEDQESGSDSRFNEIGGSNKKRRTSPDCDGVDDHDEQASLFGSPIKSPDQGPSVNAQSSLMRSGPFFEDSDEDEVENQAEVDVEQSSNVANAQPLSKPPIDASGVPENEDEARELGQSSPPPLIKEETSYAPELEDFKDFDEEVDFDEDIYEGGDEFMERQYMEEQARLEAEENDGNGFDPSSEMGSPQIKTEQEHISGASIREESECPICGIGLGGVNEQDAGVHVNNCLDGNPTPLPIRKKEPSPECGEVKAVQGIAGTPFKRPVRPPKPGQASPFVLGESSLSGGSAFSKLMSGHAEDAAWSEAAAAEHASRGKPSYQRTCPFYKILPGLFICVDAFRYGAVAGCQAYFLSHFHSDHYIGLTSSWCHGPIYCSRVTANLVRQQLRVDPKYVIGLEWEQGVEVPGTRGVQVTMISANHCPGSSLFLFEKAVGKKTNGEPRLQRILHCGDFRACRKHIEHPLLAPSVQDAVHEKNKEQKIDVCYLDTTYLNPKYAFPNQERVIKACADMCVSLNKPTTDETDGWEQMKRQRAGEGMVKFVRKESNSEIKQEPQDDDDEAVGSDMKVEQNPHGSQQILSSTDTQQQTRGRLLVVVGTYSIGKERICLGIARALNSKIYAPPSKQRIVAALEDPELNALMTTDPRAAQVHMTPLFEIRAETLDDYLKDYFPHFSRAVGFRPSGWNYRPPNSRFLDSPAVSTVLDGENWKSNYSMRDLVPQRGSSSRASCFGVPYSEHSSFRELTMFCCALRIDKIVPTVNVGSAKSREKMKAWCDRWAAEKKKNGLWSPPEDESW